MMDKPIHVISIPNPFFEGRNTVYVLREDPITLIDTGVATGKAFAALREGLAELGLHCRDVRRVVLTHKHIDHIGNAWRLQREGDSQVLIFSSETKSVQDVDPSGGRFAELVRARMKSWGAPVERTPTQKDSGMPDWELEACQPLALTHDQQLPMESGPLEVVHTPGHTAGSICLRWGDALFSGDHVLESMSPNVGAGDLRSRGLLGRYMESLQLVRDLDVARTFPGHGEPFGSPQERCHELLSHHEDRLAAILKILRDRPATVYDVAGALFGEMNSFHLLLGCAEANAHLELLQQRGAVTVTDEDVPRHRLC